MRKTVAFWGAMLVIMVPALWAVQQKSEAASDKVSSQSTAVKRPVSAYRVDFALAELEDGRTVNVRKYSMSIRGAKSEFPQDIEAQTLKIGSRIPVSIEDKKIEYLEVGTSIWCRLEERGNELLLNVRAEISNFATPGQAGQTDRPVLRQLSIDGSTVAEPGKPVILGTVQDPNSNRSYQLQVTATTLR